MLRRHSEPGPGNDGERVNCLLVTGKGKLRFLDGIRRPALADGFTPCIKADGIRSVSAQVAEQGAFPAAEAVTGNRYRQRYVDSDHTDLDMVGEIAALPPSRVNMQVPFPYSCSSMSCIASCRLRTRSMHKTGPNISSWYIRMSRCDPVKQAAAHKIAFRLIRHINLASVHHQFSAFRDARINVAAYFFKVRITDQGSHFITAVDTRTDLQVGYPRGQFGYHLVGHCIADTHYNGHSHTALAAGAISGAH